MYAQGSQEILQACLKISEIFFDDSRMTPSLTLSAITPYVYD